MRLIRLSIATSDYLRTATFLSPELYEALQRQLDDSPHLIALDDATAEEVRKSFTHRLAQVGFDEEYNLSGEGGMLEELVDRFSS